jgi:hypothetical protein
MQAWLPIRCLEPAVCSFAFAQKRLYMLHYSFMSYLKSFNSSEYTGLHISCIKLIQYVHTPFGLSHITKEPCEIVHG